jgi:hypothetical protein
LYQSADGIVLALRFAIAQTGHESTILGQYDESADDLTAGEFRDEDMDCDDDITIGRKTEALMNSQKSIRDVLQAAKWLDVPRDGLLDINTERFFAPYKARRTWAEILKSERKLYATNKLSDMPPPDHSIGGIHTANKVEVVPHDYFNPTSMLTQESGAGTSLQISRRACIQPTADSVEDVFGRDGRIWKIGCVQCNQRLLRCEKGGISIYDSRPDRFNCCLIEWLNVSLSVPNPPREEKQE